MKRCSLLGLTMRRMVRTYGLPAVRYSGSQVFSADAVLGPVSPLLLGIADVVGTFALPGSDGSFFVILDDKVKLGQTQIGRLCVAQPYPSAGNAFPVPTQP